MIVKNFSQLKKELVREFHTKEFTLETRGPYKPEDSDWNYKDVPHLNIVHSQVDSMFTWMEGTAVASINYQKIGPFSFPMTVFNFESEKFDQVYYTSFGPILLLVNTISTADDIGCKVVTTYLLAAKRPFNWVFGFLQKVITRNYRILMSEDTPMRLQRGLLREHDHHFFNPNSTYTFEFTTELQRNNVRLNEADKSVQVDIEDLIKTNLENFGDEFGVLKFRAEKSDEKVIVWPTTCPHEGADLSNCKGTVALRCPWHGRALSPVFTLEKSGELKKFKNSPYQISRKNNKITIRYEP